MPLYDVTYPRETLVDPIECQEYVAIKALKRKLHPTTYARAIKTITEGVDSVRPSNVSRLVWTCMSSLFGMMSGQPKRNIDHLWDSVISAVGDDKECLMAVGALLRAEIATRPETWLVYRRETGETDPLTGKVITISEYWINENYRPKTIRVKKYSAEQPTQRRDMSLAEQLSRHFPVGDKSRILVKRRDGLLEPTATI